MKSPSIEKLSETPLYVLSFAQKSTWQLFLILLRCLCSGTDALAADAIKEESDPDPLILILPSTKSVYLTMIPFGEIPVNFNYHADV